MFSPDVMSILKAGTSLIVGTAGADGEPRATRGFAFDIVDAEMKLLRLVVSADDPVAVDNLQTGAIAVTAGDVLTLRSVQMKGRITLVEPPTDHDRALVDEQSALFFRSVQEIDGHAQDLVCRMLAISMISVEMVVEQLFDQSPGPGAGRPVAMNR